ncbi:hypothetical protein [Bailinhaonella thermotolerans]|uniref:hypothetical protein n=1 Tax=Bailinhaonella thermotolerans TaxID=1070861 RepID=UPI00192A4F3F|nr:hypothetical protein [Bailinhaonella thermotolerans]
MGRHRPRKPAGRRWPGRPVLLIGAAAVGVLLATTLWLTRGSEPLDSALCPGSPACAAPGRPTPSPAAPTAAAVADRVTPSPTPSRRPTARPVARPRVTTPPPPRPRVTRPPSPEPLPTVPATAEPYCCAPEPSQ